MIVACIGSRNFNDAAIIEEWLDRLHRKTGISEYVSGGAKGPDSIGEAWAKRKGIPVVVFLPDYEKYGRGAPLKRNVSIAELSEMCVSFWDGISTGTRHCMGEFRKLDKPVWVIDSAGNRRLWQG